MRMSMKRKQVVVYIFIVIKAIAFLILLLAPLHNRSGVADFVVDQCLNYFDFYIYIDIALAVLYGYWGIRRMMAKNDAIWAAALSVLQILLGLLLFFMAIVHVF